MSCAATIAGSWLIMVGGIIYFVRTFSSERRYLKNLEGHRKR